MIRAIVLAATLAAGMLPTLADAGPEPARAVPTTQALVDDASRAWLAREWQDYAQRFVTADGRVVDNGNGDVSHSEGQGYGLLLAARVGDAARFETIWHWTAAHLMVRKDGLAAWKWQAGAVADTNNASDGDVLIAWGLWEAARRFDRADYRAAAEGIARAIGAAIVTKGSASILLPGAQGFAAGEQPDGPIVNLSYWVFPAFPALGDLAPKTDWAGLRRNGLALLDASRFGSHGLPTDWVALAGDRPRPAKNFPPVFGYNAIRIPLYLALDGAADARRALHRFAGTWTREGAGALALDGQPAGIVPPIGTAGYDLVLAVARCVAGGQAIPPEMINTRSDLYYPETLRLLSVLAIQERYPACL